MTIDMQPLQPGSTIGILGGGQLGRMLAIAAAKMGMRVHIFCPDPYAPAFDVAAIKTVAHYEDEAALDAFASDIDCGTIEFENIPIAAIQRVANHVQMRPGKMSVEVAQDRLIERHFIQSVGVDVAPFHEINKCEDMAAFDFDAGAAVLKIRKLGYDGKGQAMVTSLSQAVDAFNSFGSQPAILEQFIAFRCEVSVIVARDIHGHIQGFEPARNEHHRHILAKSTVPAGIEDSTINYAFSCATKIAQTLNHIGVLAVEFFVLDTDNGERLIVNEIAPRVHNSGHWTQDGANICQFEQHIRAISGWPLVKPITLFETEMTNLIGEDASSWMRYAAEPEARLHLYAKRQIRPGRKMGHINRRLPTDKPLSSGVD